MTRVKQYKLPLYARKEDCPRKPIERKKELSDLDWENRFEKYQDKNYYSRTWISAGSNATSLDRFAKNPTGPLSYR